MPDHSRRSFIKSAALGSAGVIFAPYIAKSAWTKNSPNDRVQHAIIGTGRRGLAHCKNFTAVKGCQLVSVSDVDNLQMTKALQGVTDENQIVRHLDFHKILDDKSIDSVTISTPDHWHTPLALAALMAGKHVYLEKPCSHNVREANLLVKAAKHFGKCVQHGTQRRSDGDHIEAMRQLQQGIIGKIHTVKAINHQFRAPIGKAVVEAVPAGVDYDRWLGPAPKAEFTKNRWHYEWHWFWDYGGGDMTNDGVHQIDVAVWALGNKYPKRIVVTGGQYFYKDDHQTPDTQTAILEYDDNQIIYEMRLWTPDKLEGHDNGNVVYGTEGKMDFGRGGVIVTKGKETIKIKSPEPVEACVPNFITAVRENNPSKLLSPIEKGAVSVNICNLANIATRLGAASIEYDPIKETVKCPGFDEKAKAMLGRTYRKGYELPYKG